MSEKKNRSWPMTREQSFIAAAVFVSFFVLWFLWAAVGDKFICWIGGKSNLSGWVQAIGSLMIVGVTVFLWSKDRLLMQRKELQEIEIENVKFRTYVASNYYLISSADAVVNNYRLWHRVMETRKARGLDNFFPNIYLVKKISVKIKEMESVFSAFLFPYEVQMIPACHLDKLIMLHGIAMEISVITALVFQDDVELINKYHYYGGETIIRSDIPNVECLESVLAFNLKDLSSKIDALEMQIKFIKNV